MPGPRALEYENRMGVVYYLQEGKTTTGKPTYYTSKKPTGIPLAALPEGYEFYERPDTAQVVVRRARSSSITEFERKQVEAIVLRASGLEHVVVEIDGDALVVHTPSVSGADADREMSMLGGSFFGLATARAEEYRAERLRHCQYMKMLRFELVDPDKREYRAERWCFRGSIDNWISLSGCGSLAKIVEKYAKHLDRESFFELL
jgi:hypothetical protein